MAKHIVENLIKKELIEPNIPANTLIEETEKLLLEELMAEDRLNDEVRQLLRKYETDIERGRLDYRKLFDMTKQKLVRERNIVL
ncbi:MAG: DUF507 family protein [Nitrospirae bacterium]|nr:DUF507 family protein [Nitrospirota bacterium]